MNNTCRPFWQRLSEHGTAPALIDGRTSGVTTYGELDSLAQRYADLLGSSGKGLVFLSCEGDVDGIAIYLACLLAGHAVFISNPQGPRDHAEALLGLHKPDFMVARKSRDQALWSQTYTAVGTLGGYSVLRRSQIADPPPHPLLALLLSTSASTGSPKLVRHSAHAVDSNARQIVNALKVTPDDRALSNLPLHYVYGLSVLNSHLAAGASVVLHGWPSASANFWSSFVASRATTLPAVSYTIECMLQLGISREKIPTLCKLMHSGSRLPAEAIAWTREQIAQRGADVYLMYGQTEACGRMTVLPPERFDRAPSVGLPVEGASIELSAAGEIIFSGPNVMLGYASSRQCMGLGDELDGRLATGDTGFIGADGLLFLHGRRDRVCKILSHRINLDELEADIGGSGDVVLVEFRGQVAAIVEGNAAARRSGLLKRIIDIRLPPQAFSFFELPGIPRGSSGKVDYGRLRSMLESGELQGDFAGNPVERDA